MRGKLGPGTQLSPLIYFSSNGLDAKLLNCLLKIHAAKGGEDRSDINNRLREDYQEKEEDEGIS